MSGNIVNIQSVITEIKQGKKRKKKQKEEEQDDNIMSASATQGGHNKWSK